MLRKIIFLLVALYLYTISILSGLIIFVPVVILNKFNKNIVLLTLREMTNLNTKEIRTYLKKYKSLYLETLKKIHNQ